MQVLTTAQSPPHRYASSPDMLASVEHGARNRLATVFFYLNNVSADGL